MSNRFKNGGAASVSLLLEKPEQLRELTFVNLSEVEGLLQTHCTELRVVKHFERCVQVEKELLNIRMSFYEGGWQDPYENRALAAKLFGYALYIAFFVEGLDAHPPDDALEAIVKKNMYMEAQNLAEQFPGVAKAFENVYSVNFTYLWVGTYYRRGFRRG